jgi:uncharacterized protein (DUF697 family)
MVEQAIAGEWTLVPETPRDIEALREKCRALVRRKATLAGGIAAIPIPGLDIVTDMSMFAKVVDEINRTFGLTEEQVSRLEPSFRIIAYQAALGAGGMMVGKTVTQRLLTAVFKRIARKVVVKQAAKVVPFAGQLTAAAIGFTAFRKLGYHHIDACAKVAQELLAAKTASASGQAKDRGTVPAGQSPS